MRWKAEVEREATTSTPASECVLPLPTRCMSAGRVLRPRQLRMCFRLLSEPSLQTFDPTAPIINGLRALQPIGPATQHDFPIDDPIFPLGISANDSLPPLELTTGAGKIARSRRTVCEVSCYWPCFRRECTGSGDRCNISLRRRARLRVFWCLDLMQLMLIGFVFMVMKGAGEHAWNLALTPFPSRGQRFACLR